MGKIHGCTLVSSNILSLYTCKECKVHIFLPILQKNEVLINVIRSQNESITIKYIQIYEKDINLQNKVISINSCIVKQIILSYNSNVITRKYKSMQILLTQLCDDDL